MKPIMLYYETKDGFKTVINKETIIQLIDKLPKFDYNCFYVQVGYEPSDEGLLKYQQDFFIAVDQLKEIVTRDGVPIDYCRYYSHNDAVLLLFFEKFIGTKTIYEHWKGNKFIRGRSDADIEPIDYLEAKWINRLNNGGLTYFDKTKADTTQECYGYDFKSFYPSMLGNYMKFPSKRGSEKTIDSIPLDSKGKVQYGFYRAYIAYNDDEFHKLFALSKDNTYSNYSLDTALKYESLNLFGVQVHLLDEENNAYIYNEKDIIGGCTYFGYWYKTLYDFKQKYPKNCLIKHLLSSFWGHLCQYNKIYGDADKFPGTKTDDFEDPTADFYTIKNGISKKDGNQNKDYYIACPRDKIYKYGLARIKPFLVSMGRSYMEHQAIYPNLDKVIRIYTDGVVFSSNDIIVPNIAFVPEEKTTGLIHWTNLQEYKKL